jgi:hypothetical protein
MGGSPLDTTGCPLSHTHNSTSLIVPSHSSCPLRSFSFSSLTVRLPRMPNIFPGPLRICVSALLLSLRHTRNSQDTISRFLTVPTCQYFETSVCASPRKTSTHRLRPLLSQLGVATTTISRCYNCTCHRCGPFRSFSPVMVPAPSTLVSPSDKNADFLVASRWIKAPMSSSYLSCFFLLGV